MHQTSSLDHRISAPDLADAAEARARARAWAERLYAERRRRDALFPPDLFGEPAWDLLLAMFTARERGLAMILCRAYKAAGVTDTTGRRLPASRPSRRRCFFASRRVDPMIAFGSVMYSTVR